LAELVKSDLPLETTVGGAPPPEPAKRSKWYHWRRRGTALVAYLLDSEVHTFAFSVAANAILSFIPFVVLMYTLALSVFHSQAMVDVITQMVNYFFPTTTREPNWLANNMRAAAALSSRHGVQAFSLLVILISCTGIFLPLEVALNQAWGVSRSRNYLFNQAVAFGLALILVALGMGSVALNASANTVLTFVFFHHTDNFFFTGLSSILLTLSTGVAVILFFFCVYWILPNRKVPAMPVLRVSIATGIIWLLLKEAFADVLPHLDLRSLYGAFYVSVGLLFWAYISGLILFAGAQFSVARIGNETNSTQPVSNAAG
jgi:membrane protein/epoxyqueuosine reductase